MLQTLQPEKLIAEAIGTFTLVFVGAGAILVTGGQDLVAIALAYGLAVAVMVSMLGHVSGGLFNPALTIGLWVTRRLDAVDTVAYIVAQLIGAVVGALLLFVLFPEPMREAQELGTPLLNPGIDFMQGVGIEVVLTIFLMLAVFGTALDPRGPRVGGFAIGLVITMDVLTAGGLTGAAMNPARVFGPALVAGAWENHLVWWIGPVIGAVLAALAYHYIFLYGAEEVLTPEEVVSIET